VQNHFTRQPWTGATEHAPEDDLQVETIGIACPDHLLVVGETTGDDVGLVLIPRTATAGVDGREVPVMTNTAPTREGEQDDLLTIDTDMKKIMNAVRVRGDVESRPQAAKINVASFVVDEDAVQHHRLQDSNQLGILVWSVKTTRDLLVRRMKSQREVVLARRPVMMTRKDTSEGVRVLSLPTDTESYETLA
jgi:hypothetical protein